MRTYFRHRDRFTEWPRSFSTRFRRHGLPAAAVQSWRARVSNADFPWWMADLPPAAMALQDVDFVLRVFQFGTPRLRLSVTTSRRIEQVLPQLAWRAPAGRRRMAETRDFS
jgi:hypothetical protein